MSSAKKLEEAQFFLELLDALVQRARPLTRSGDTAKEASYLFSAVMNSFYATVVIMKEEEDVNVEAFRQANPEIYATIKNGGERAKTVHKGHTEVAMSGYIPPKGDSVNFDFRAQPLLIEESRRPGHVDLVMGPNHYMYIELQGKHVDVGDFCRQHFYKLKTFHAASTSC